MKNRAFPCSRAVGLALFSALVLLAGSALAEDIDVTAAESLPLEKSVLGLGVGFAPDYEGSDDYTGVPLLQARFTLDNDMYFSLLGNTARFNLIPNKTWSFGPLLRYRGERDDVESDRVDAMKQIDAAIEAGAFLSFTPPNWIFSISAAQDVADAHDGYVIDLGAGYRYKFQQQTLMTFFAKTTYASEDYMDTYFGVSLADSIRSGRGVPGAGFTPYSADAEWKDIGGGILVQHNLTPNWGVLGVVKYTKLLGDASDSPLVDVEGDDNQGFLGLIVNYRF